MTDTFIWLQGTLEEKYVFRITVTLETYRPSEWHWEALEE